MSRKSKLGWGLLGLLGLGFFAAGAAAEKAEEGDDTPTGEPPPPGPGGEPGKPAPEGEPPTGPEGEPTPQPEPQPEPEPEPPKELPPFEPPPRGQRDGYRAGAEQSTPMFMDFVLKTEEGPGQGQVEGFSWQEGRPLYVWGIYDPHAAGIAVQTLAGVPDGCRVEAIRLSADIFSVRFFAAPDEWNQLCRITYTDPDGLGANWLDVRISKA